MQIFSKLKAVKRAFFSVYGKLEPADSDQWFVLFALDDALNPSTFPAVNEAIAARDTFAKCRRFDAVREVELEVRRGDERRLIFLALQAKPFAYSSS